VVYPFSRSLKKKTNYSSSKLYDQSIKYYQSQWNSLVPESKANTSQLNVEDKKGTYTTYKYPYFDTDGHTIVYKSSYKEIGGFYRIGADGKETLIKRLGRILDSYYSYKNEKLVWAEVGQDERWGWQVNSNIIYYDIEHRKRKKLTTSSKYFSPDLSYDGKMVVAFHATIDQSYRLHILDVETGSLSREIPNPDNYYYSYPKWAENDAYIIAIARDNKGRNALVKIEPESGKVEKLIAFTYHQIGIPWQKDKYIYFSASYTGVDNIHCVHLENGNIYKVSEVITGAYMPAVKGKELYYSEFSSLGNNIKIMTLDAAKLIKTKYLEPKNMDQYNSVSAIEEGGDITDLIPDKNYATKKYASASKLINLHSWSIYFADPNFEWALYSNNILNTLAMKLGVRYNRNDNNFIYFFNLSYAQLYPVFSLDANYTRRQDYVPTYDADGNFVQNENIAWGESEIKPGVAIPFDLSSGMYTRALSIGAKYAFTSVNFENNANVELTDFNLHSSQMDLRLLNTRKKARQNIYSSYSQYLNFSSRNSLDDLTAKQLFVDSELTFPGVFKNHNLVFQLSYQQEDAENDYAYSDNFSYARGYNRPVYDFIYKIGSNYHMPLIYPDWGFLGILYFYRLRSNVFFDYSRMHLLNSDSNAETIQMYNSVGGELVLDSRLLNLFDFSLGFRYSYLLNEDPQVKNLEHSFEIFIPVLRF
jgi:hypothetical protein